MLSLKIGVRLLDINYLLAREQTSLFRAAQAQSPGARVAHLTLAHAYRARLTAAGARR